MILKKHLNIKNMPKKNLNKIPKDIIEKISRIDSGNIIVGGAKKFKAEYLSSGKLSHLNIVLNGSGLVFPASIVPPEEQGKYSSRNIYGYEEIRRDLPKETHYNSVESPNYGDSYNGTHTVNLPYEKYPRDFHSPKELEIFINCENPRSGLQEYIITFQVQEIINKDDANFDSNLLENLNILQENVGFCDVKSADIPMEENTKSLNVSWEILPPGTADEAVERIFHGRTPTQQQKDTTKERYDFFQSLKPKSFVFGQSGFRRYFGALLEDNLVVFENIEYGNAVYILFDNWEELSKLTRLDLMSGRFGDSFERVIHSSGWKGNVRTIIAHRRELIS